MEMAINDTLELQGATGGAQKVNKIRKWKGQLTVLSMQHVKSCS